MSTYNRFDLGLVPGPSSYVRVACSSCGDYNDGDSSGEVAGDGQGLPALKPNVAIIIIGLGFTLVVVAAFAVFAKFMRPHMNRQNGSGTSRLWEDVIKDGSAVDAKVIKSLPLVVYAAESFQGLNLDLECAVCLSEFEEGEELRLLPSCKHMFHPGCIDGWLRSHPFCPLCRSSVLSTSWAELHSPPALSTSWALPSPPHSSSTARNTFEASMPESEGRGSSTEGQQQPPSLEPHVEIPVMERTVLLCSSRSLQPAVQRTDDPLPIPHMPKLTRCMSTTLGQK